MIRTWIRKLLPNSEQLDAIPILRRYKSLFDHPNLWAINRRSVAGGVAAGLFCGLIPGPFQVIGSLLWVFVAKVNLPVAILVTFYTNPLTIVPLYLFAVAYGQLLLGGLPGDAPIQHAPDFSLIDMSGYLHALLDWTLSLGPALAVGLPATMCTFALLGYLFVRISWSSTIRMAVIRRRRRQIK
ncbi:MAG: DUF2062 domain-containing protein [Limnobacter sp.]|nr:DUF2062 domain-containing protein [Limnobacter sp.]